MSFFLLPGFCGRKAHRLAGSDFPLVTYLAEDEDLSLSPMPVFLYSSHECLNSRDSRRECVLVIQPLQITVQLKLPICVILQENAEWQGGHTFCMQALTAGWFLTAGGSNFLNHTKHWLSECKLRVHSHSFLAVEKNQHNFSMQIKI